MEFDLKPVGRFLRVVQNIEIGQCPEKSDRRLGLGADGRGERGKQKNAALQ